MAVFLRVISVLSLASSREVDEGVAVFLRIISVISLVSSREVDEGAREVVKCSKDVLSWKLSIDSLLVTTLLVTGTLLDVVKNSELEMVWDDATGDEMTVENVWCVVVAMSEVRESFTVVEGVTVLYCLNTGNNVPVVLLAGATVGIL